MIFFSSATLVGTPQKGQKCIFEYNASGYKGFGTQTSNTGSLTITRLYTITYNGNGHTGGTVPEAVDKKHGTNITLSSSTPTRTGYTFVGWNTKADGTGTTYAAGATYSTNADVTLYAQWEIREDKIVLWADNGSFGTNASGGKIKEYVLYIQYGTNTFYTKDDQGNKTYVTAPTLKDKRYLKEDEGGCVEVHKKSNTTYEYVVKLDGNCKSTDDTADQCEINGTKPVFDEFCKTSK